MEIETKYSEYKQKDTNGILSNEEEDRFPVELIKPIDNVAKEIGYTNYRVLRRPISTDGGNYLGLLYEVNIKGATIDGEKETNIFIKRIISGDHHTVLSVSDCYQKESFMYKELAKVFAELENDAEVPVEERLNMAKSYNETNTEAIILDNLTKKGYKTLYRMDVMPLTFAELSIKQLAKFHGLCLVLQLKRPDYFNKNLKNMKQPFICNEDWKTFIRNMCKLASESLNDALKEKIQKFIPRIFEIYPKYITDESSQANTICHGDYRVNNILVKEINGEVKDVIPVDYQLLYYGCPINDLIYFIFTGTDRKFRKQHLNNLKNLYYNHLEKFLNYFDIDINGIYPRNEFERQFEERLDYGLMFGLYCTPFLFTVEDQVPDMGKEDLTNLTFVLDPRVHERIQGIVDDFIEWGRL